MGTDFGDWFPMYQYADLFKLFSRKTLVAMWQRLGLTFKVSFVALWPPRLVYCHEYDERANRENLGTNRNPIQSANLRLFL